MKNLAVFLARLAHSLQILTPPNAANARVASFLPKDPHRALSATLAHILCRDRARVTYAKSAHIQISRGQPHVLDVMRAHMPIHRARLYAALIPTVQLEAQQFSRPSATRPAHLIWASPKSEQTF